MNFVEEQLQGENMDHLVAVVNNACVEHAFCPAWAELEEAAVVLSLAVFLTFVSAWEIFTRRLYGTTNDLRHLKDDSFDITLLAIYGVGHLILLGMSLRSGTADLKPDVLLYNILLATAALKLKDSTSTGIIFTTLSYSSWYGLYCMLTTRPVTDDLYVLLSPQWLSCLVAFAAPALIANLKYPALIQSSLAMVTYGSVIFGLLVACNASFVFADLAALHYRWFPGYAESLTSGQTFRLYGRGLGLLDRIGYYLGMVVLQLVCVRIPHLLIDEDSLQEQLREQAAVARELAEAHQRSKPAGASSRAPTHRTVPASSRAGAGAAAGAGEGTDGGDEVTSDLPADCVEVTPEEAIRLQERGMKKAAQATGGMEGVPLQTGGEDSQGVKQRRKPKH